MAQTVPYHFHTFALVRVVSLQHIGTLASVRSPSQHKKVKNVFGYTDHSKTSVIERS